VSYNAIFRKGYAPSAYRLEGANVPMNLNQKHVKTDFRKLINADRCTFPPQETWEKIPNKQGVYIIYAPRIKKVVHVGRTYRGKAGLRQRLKNHLHGSSSFTVEYLKREGKKLRSGYTFRYLRLRPWRRRALLEAYATGSLCLAHIGKHHRELGTD
jgi:hypothetical protein